MSKKIDSAATAIKTNRNDTVIASDTHEHEHEILQQQQQQQNYHHTQENQLHHHHHCHHHQHQHQHQQYHNDDDADVDDANKNQTITSVQTTKKNEIRIWCDGCYDLVHFGHANSLRQAKQLGDKVIVGIHSDEEITKHKGPPVFTQEERYRMVQSIKWVDQVVMNAPYVTTLEMLDKYDCDFCVHGDDITTNADGVDTYHVVKSANRYREVQRTAGVSTTDLVGRMLRATQQQHGSNMNNNIANAVRNENEMQAAIGARSPWTGSSPFLLTTQKIRQFTDDNISTGCVASKSSTDRIVYVAGAFDLFHVGHLDFLTKAKRYGDYLIVGLHNDDIVNSYSAGGGGGGVVSYPIMNLQERVLNVLACKYVNEIIIGAPYCVSQDLLDQFNVSAVCHGKISLSSIQFIGGVDPYAVPKRNGIFHVIDSGNAMTTERIIARIVENRQAYERRNKLKEKKEIAAFEALRHNTERGIEKQLNHKKAFE